MQGGAVIGVLTLTYLTTEIVFDRGTPGTVSFHDKLPPGGASSSLINTTITRDGSTVDVDADVTITSTGEGGAVFTEKARLKIEMGVCPDADGRVPLNLTMQ
jgi:hypothetical protein